MGNNPKPTGKYAVGTTTFTAKELRDEVLHPGEKRRISARIYYPVTKDSVNGLEKEMYMSRDMFKGLKDAFKLPRKQQRGVMYLNVIRMLRGLLERSFRLSFLITDISPLGRAIHFFV